MDNSIPQAKRQQLRNKMLTSRKAIEALLKQFKYLDDVQHQQNMRKFCSCLENVLNVDSLYDFQKYLSNKEHIPIQTNFKCLKYEQLAQILQDWIVSKQEQSIGILDRAVTHNFKNILFKRIFIQQKDTIYDYFTTISQKKRLKGFDLFQLLTQLLSPYYMYQFTSDSQTFFQKTNSFQTFISIVESYCKNGARIYNKDLNDPNDQSYIRLHEFQALIQFWEIKNPELTVLQTPNKNMKDVGVQTNQVNSNSIQVQTDRQISKNYISILNRSMHQVNSLIQSQNDPYMLSSLDKLITSLRNQKIFAVSYESQKKPKIPMKSTISSDYSQTEPIIFRATSKTKINSPSKNRTPQKIITQTPILLTNNFVQKQEDDIKIVFRYLCSKDHLNSLTTQNLHTFFVELGLSDPHQSFLINNLLNHGFIEDQQDINIKQFKSILRQLMKQNRKFNLSTLKRYISSHIETQLRQTAYFKNMDGNHSKNKILNDSIIGGGRRNRMWNQTQTTYPMDSDGSIL